MSYKFLQVSNYYPEYLSYFYSKNNCNKMNYDENLEKIVDDCFAYGDKIIRGMKKLGNNATLIIANDKNLQKKWADEFGVKYSEENWYYEILFAQIKKIEPEVIFWSRINNGFIKKIKEEIKENKINFSQIGIKIEDINEFKEMDFMISCMKDQVLDLNKRGINSYFHMHSFNSKILDQIGKTDEKAIDFSFVGSIVSGNGFHNKRAEYLSELLKKTEIEVFSSFINPKLSSLIKNEIKPYLQYFKNVGLLKKVDLQKREMIRFGHKEIKKIKPPVFGIDMFETLNKSLVTFNVHIDVAKCAANIRLFEATGSGACLLTDSMPDIHEYFEPDYEIVVYNSIEEAIEKSKFLIDNPSKAIEIAQRGQKRTLENYNEEISAFELDKIIKENIKSK